MSRNIPLTMLPYNGKIGQEVRVLYFYRAFGLPEDRMRIISFGACNFRCPYCKRGSFEEDQGIDEHAVPATPEEIQNLSLDAISKGQVVRISGGDPVMYEEESIALGKFVRENGGRFSMAHNGSGPRFAERIAPLLECAAIDIKGNPAEYPLVAGVGINAYETAFKTIEILLRNGVIVDVRTPIFGFTKYETLEAIAGRLEALQSVGRVFYTLRLFSDVNSTILPEPDKNVAVGMAKLLKVRYPNLPIGMRSKWDPQQSFVFF